MLSMHDGFKKAGIATKFLYIYILSYTIQLMLDSAGGFGVPLYIKIVDSEGDTWGRCIQPSVEPNADNEITSFGVEGGIVARSEGRSSCLCHGDRVRPGREQPYYELLTLGG